MPRAGGAEIKGANHTSPGGIFSAPACFGLQSDLPKRKWFGLSWGQDERGDILERAGQGMGCTALQGCEVTGAQAALAITRVPGERTLFRSQPGVFPTDCILSSASYNCPTATSCPVSSACPSTAACQPLSPQLPPIPLVTTWERCL